MNKTNPKVDWYFNKAKQWKEEYEKLRTIILDCRTDRRIEVGCSLLHV